MAFKTVTDLSTDTMVSLGGFNKKTGKNNPTSIEGYFLGSRQVESKKSKTGFAYIYTLQTAKGNVGVWGKTDLDRKMQAVTPGQMIRASFDKMVATPNGEMYKFKVEVDADNTIEVSAAQSATQGASGSNDEDAEEAPEFNSSDDNFEGTESEVDEDAAQAAALAVISTYHAGIPEVVVHNQTGYLVEEGDVTGMSQYMLKILESPEKAKKMGEAGRIRVIEHFTMKKHIDTLQKALSDASNRK